MTKQKRNVMLCRIVSLLILVMLVKYNAIFTLVRDASVNVPTAIIGVLFYGLNIASMIGLFMVKRWGFIVSYFAIPISTFLFAVSYLSFAIDWMPISVRIYVVPIVNALLLVGIVSLQVQRHRFSD